MKFDYFIKENSYSHYIIENSSKDEYFKHVHNSYEILLFVSGECEYFVEYKQYKLKPYDLVFIKPGEFHFLNMLNDDSKYERFVLNIQKDDENHMILEKIFNKFSCINVNDYPAIKNAFIDSELLLKNCGEKNNTILKHVENDILYKIDTIKEYEHENMFNDENLFTKIVVYINDNIQNKITIESLSKVFFISKSNLCYIFNKNLGISPIKYLRQKRLALAKSLIEEGNKITDIADFCGFESYNTFVRAFKKMFEYEPSHFKKTSK